MNPVQRERKRRKWTQGDLEERSGVKQSIISRIENGRIEASLSQLRAFAEAFEISPGELLRETTAAERQSILSPPEAVPAANDGAAMLAPKGMLERLAEAIGALSVRPGCYLWQVRDRSMQLAGYMPGDLMLVLELNAEAERQLHAGDPVIAQVIEPISGEATTVFRRFDPPFLTALSLDPEDKPVLGVEAHIRGKVMAAFRLPEIAA